MNKQRTSYSILNKLNPELNREEAIVEEIHYKNEGSGNLFNIFIKENDEGVIKIKSNIREEINLANYNLNDLKNRLAIMNKTNSDDITNLLFAKSNDIINNANNFMKKYKSKDDENDYDNNKNEEVEKENIEKLNYEKEENTANSQGNTRNTSIHENESNTNFKRKEKLDYERSSQTQKVDRFTVNESSKDLRRFSKGKRNSKRSINTENNENETKKKEDTDELLARIDKLLISNGLLDRTNKDLVLHLKHLEDEIEYINKHR